MKGLKYLAGLCSEGGEMWIYGPAAVKGADWWKHPPPLHQFFMTVFHPA